MSNQDCNRILFLMIRLRALADLQATIASVRRTLPSESAVIGKDQADDFDVFLSQLEHQIETFSLGNFHVVDLEESVSKGPDLAFVRPIVAIAAINNFSSLRLEFGQTALRTVLDEIVERLRLTLGEIKFGRTSQGYIEFIFDGATHNVDTVLKSAHQSVISSIVIGSQSIKLDITIGYSDFIDNQDQIDAAFDRAEYALTQARMLYQDVATYTSEDRRESEVRQDLARALRGALAGDEMYVCYQPKLNIKEGRIDSVEALVRWNSPTHGQMSPEDFIEMAESLGIIRPITRFVITTALAAWDDLNAAGLAMPININLSGALVSDFSFILWLMDTLKGNADRLSFEITETSVISKPTQALRNLNIMADCGLGIAIDDYGKGLSSLSYLKLIPANEIKIDKSFVMNLTKSHVDPLLLRSTIDLAHGLGMTVTAEGVESPSSMALLKIMGCDHAQGFHISQPLSFDDLKAYLTQFNLNKENKSGPAFSIELSPPRLADLR